MGGRFVKGVSANPGGRPKMTPRQRLAIKMIAKASPDIVRDLLRMFHDETTDIRVRKDIGLALLTKAGVDAPQQAQIALSREDSDTERVGEEMLRALALGKAKLVLEADAKAAQVVDAEVVHNVEDQAERDAGGEGYAHGVGDGDD